MGRTGKIAAGVALLMFCLVGPVRADLTWGTLTTNSGPSIMDWMVQDWIDDYFEDGSKGDGSVGSNILVVGTSCYFGDFKDNFNGTTGDGAGGGAFDTVKFTNLRAGCDVKFVSDTWAAFPDRVLVAEAPLYLYYESRSVANA